MNNKQIQCAAAFVLWRSCENNKINRSVQYDYHCLFTHPDSVFFCEPSTRRLQAGIFDNLVNPPAIPKILAAVDAPRKLPEN